MSVDVASAPLPMNLVLRQLEGIRREMAAIRERQDRTQQLVVRLDAHMESRFAESRTAITELKSDLVLMENGLLNRHNEILEILRRLDEEDRPAAGIAPAFAVEPGSGDLGGSFDDAD